MSPRVQGFFPREPETPSRTQWFKGVLLTFSLTPHSLHCPFLPAAPGSRDLLPSCQMLNPPASPRPASPPRPAPSPPRPVPPPQESIAAQGLERSGLFLWRFGREFIRMLSTRKGRSFCKLTVFAEQKGNVEPAEKSALKTLSRAFLQTVHVLSVKLH